MRIDTERLTLREFTLDDVERLYALESIPEVVRYQTYEPKSRSQAETYVRGIVSSRSETPRRCFELAAVHEGRFVGRVGGWVEGGTATLWYSFMPSAQGRGLASEAVRALIPLLDARRLVIECDPRNEASWRLAERLGFTRESFTERAYKSKGEWVGSVVYAKSLEDAIQRPSAAAPRGSA